MIKAFEKIHEYFERLFDTTTTNLKRSIDDDHDDYEDDRVEENMSSPPFKRGKFTDTIPEPEVKVIRSGSVNTSRISDANFYSCRKSSTRLYPSVMSTPKGVERIIPIRIESSVSSNKENSPFTLSPTFAKNKEEITPVTSKYFNSDSKFNNQNDDEQLKRSLNSTFRFMPTLTSTAQRSESSEVVGATKRKPLRSSDLTPSKWSRLPLRSSKFDLSRKLTNFSRSNKQRPSIFSRNSLRMYLTPRESFRLDERERYSQLLQQHTSSDVTLSRFSGRSQFLSLLGKGVFNEDEPEALRSGAIVKTRVDPRSSLKSKRLLEKRESSPVKSPSPAPIEIRITRDLSTSKNVPLIDLEPEKEINKEIKLDDDLIIVKEIKPPETRKNALENELRKSLSYSHEWLKEMTDIYHDKKNSGDDDVEIMFETKKKCQESREKHEKEFLKKVEERISQLDIAYPSPYIEATEEEEEVLPELTPEIESIIDKAFRGPPSQVLADKFSIQITRRDIHTLAGLNWLNDEVINFYMNMLMERGKNDNYPSVYAFNTFFYSKLVKTGYASVKRWTKKVDIFSYDLLIIPVHLGMHWCLATIDFRNKTINYYDSMHGNNNTCLMELSKYLESEHKDKKKTSYDSSKFSAENVKDIPQQMNGSDCGMFSCKFAEYLSRDAPITFTQEHMPYFRRRMVYEIVTQKLM